MLHVSHQTLSKWETGILTPDIEKLVSLAALFQVSVDYLCGIENSFEQTINSIISETNYRQLSNFDKLQELYNLLEKRIKPFPINEQLLIHQLKFMRWMHDYAESGQQQKHTNKHIFSIAQKILDISQNDEYRSYANYNMAIYFCEQAPTEAAKRKAIEYGEKVRYKDMSITLFCTLGKHLMSDDFAAGCFTGIDLALEGIRRIIRNYAIHIRQYKNDIEKCDSLKKYAEAFAADAKQSIYSQLKQ